MKTNWKKVACLLLAGLTVLGSTGCGESGGGVVNLDDLYIPTYVDNGESVRTFTCLPPNFANRDLVEQYKAAGMNAAIYVEDYVKASEVATHGENSAYIKGMWKEG